MPPGAGTAARWDALREALEVFAKDADARGQSVGWARRMWGADTQEWAELEKWHGGR